MHFWFFDFAIFVNRNRKKETEKRDKDRIRQCTRAATNTFVKQRLHFVHVCRYLRNVQNVGKKIPGCIA